MSKVEDIQVLLRTVVLPRLDQMEVELNELRSVTWPVCQGLRETNGPFQFLSEKRKFFKHLFKEDAIELLKRKASFMNIRDQVILDQELESICTVHFDGSVDQRPLYAKELNVDYPEET